MTEPEKKKDFIEETLKKIHERKISMRSKAYFVWRAAGHIGVVLLAAGITLFLASLLLYYLRASGALTLLRIGPTGYRDFLVALPWWLFAIGLVGFGVVLLLSLHFRFTLKKPLALTLGGVFVGMLAASVFLSYIPFHRSIFDAAKEGRAPFATPFHRVLVNREIPHTVIGAVAEIGSTVMVLETVTDEVTVGFEKETEFIPERPLAGDMVIVHGEIEDGGVTADAVLKVDTTVGEFHGPIFGPGIRGERILVPPAY